VNLLGVGVSAISMDQAVGTIASWIERREARYVCVTPAHSLMDAYRDEAFRRILNHSGMTTPDGMAVVWLLKLYGQRQVTRVYGPDLLLAVCRRSVESGWRHFFYGGEAGVAERLAATLEQRFPGLQVAGTYSPPFGALSPEEDARVVAQLNAARPDVIWVGLSSPKQERWMAEHRERLDAPVLVGVGAAFDFLSGRKPQAPRWMQRAGLEWLFRFSHEPRRLWPRYRQYPLFVWLALMQLTGIKKFPID
jgi:N-acetylglucosaminyldiphosphoundecaprenol N-acetyl-beta-D-mannosaminyltransferase